MLHQTLVLGENPDITLTTYLHAHSDQPYDDKGAWQPEKRPAVLILPGGAYSMLSHREAEPVAWPLLAAGLQVFVLRYSVGAASAQDAPLEDVSRAVAAIRAHAGEWRVQEEQIAVMGFSAGGHLAAMLGTQWNRPGLAEGLGIAPGANRPNALMLCYPQTTNLFYDYFSPFQPLGEGFDMEWGAYVKNWRPELDTVANVGPHTPPSFLWTTSEDEKVPAANSYRFALACLEQGVPHELHVFQTGIHGLALNNDTTAYGFCHENYPNEDSWMPLGIRWLRHQFGV